MSKLKQGINWLINAVGRAWLNSSVFCRVLFVFITVLSVPLIVTNYYGFIKSRDSITQFITDEQLLHVRNDAREIELLLKQRKQMIVPLAMATILHELPDGGDGLTRTTAGEMIEGIVESSDLISQMAFVTVEGDELIKVIDIDGVLENLPEDELKNVKDADYFTETNKLGKSEVYMSEIYVNDSGIPVIRVATPSYTEDGKRVGMLLLDTNIKAVVGLLEAPVSIIEAKYIKETYLVDSNRIIISFSSDRPNVEKESLGFSCKLLKDKEIVLDLADDLVFAVPFFPHSTNRDYYITVVSVIPKGAITNSIESLKNSLLSVTLGFMGVGGLLALFLGRITSVAIDDVSLSNRLLRKKAARTKHVK